MIHDIVTLGVVITIPEPFAAVLSGWRRRVGDPLAELIPPHVTLLPPTKIDRDGIPSVEAHLEKVAESASSFTMHLIGTGTFRPMSPVVFIHVAQGIADCEVLQKSIRTGPLVRDLDFPYHPHVTVAQEIDDAALDEAYSALSGFTAKFVVDSFNLFERAPDGRWTKCREYGLSPS
jgi:2'-5' RNA ligase